MNGILFVFLGCFWGGSFIAIKYAVTHLGPLASASGRLVVASMALILIGIVFRRALLVPRKNLRSTVVVGFFLIGLPFALLFWGEQFVAPG
jgi:drug/metabolite transporter (DMT)-like permease